MACRNGLVERGPAEVRRPTCLSEEVVVSSKSVLPSGRPKAFRPQLEAVKFTIEARLAKGTMTVADLLDMKPGSIIRSKDAPGGKIRLYSGRALLGTAEPVVEEGRLALRVEDVETPGE